MLTTTPRPQSSPSTDLPRRPSSRRGIDSAEVVEQLAACTNPVRQAELQEQLIRSHMDVAACIASRYESRGISSEDLQQVAYLALTKAARRYDPCAGHSFMAFAVPTIRGEVRRYFRDHGWTVRPPRRVQELQYRLWTSQTHLEQELGRPPTPNELALDLDAPLDDVLEAMDVQHCFTPTSLDQPVEAAESDATSLGALLASPETPYATVEARTVLSPALEQLAERDRLILQMRFFEGLNQSEIGARIGVSQIQVSRLLMRIYRDLRTQLGPIEPGASVHAPAPRQRRPTKPTAPSKPTPHPHRDQRRTSTSTRAV